ncbi:MAG: hypothetical protein AB1509_04260 [Chloroflexota bacterium]|mgnify:CR=1 FL=1
MKAFFPILTLAILLTACRADVSTLPTPTQPAPPLPSPSPAVTFPTLPAAIVTPTATSLPIAEGTVCTDPAVLVLIDTLKTAILNADGELLRSLVSPDGIEVRYYRNGNVVTYTPYQAGFLFETTYEANWGNDPASGLEKRGSFHDVIVPSLVELFNRPYTLHCNELKHGGASYVVTWPYEGDFYAIHFAGTEQNGFLDWRTWAAGVEYSGGKPLLYALVQYFWEP